MNPSHSTAMHEPYPKRGTVARRATLFALVFCLASVLAWPAQVDPAAGAAPVAPGQPVLGQVTITGEAISEIRLDGPVSVCLRPPERTQALPVGTYTVRSVELYTRQRSTPNILFEVTPEGPNELKIGMPFRPYIDVTRTGTILHLRSAMVGVGGESYSGTPRTCANAFAVLLGGKRIAADQFVRG